MTMDDPIEQLRAQLVSAGHRRLEPARAPRQRVLSRKWLLTAVAALTIAAPATAAITGVLPTGGTTPDGSSYRVEQVTQDGRACERTEFRSSAGALEGKVDNCAPTAATGPILAPKDLMIDAFNVAPGKTWLIRGTISAAVAKVVIEGSTEPVALSATSNERRSFTSISTGYRPIFRALDQDGHEIDRFQIFVP